MTAETTHAWYVYAVLCGGEAPALAALALPQAAGRLEAIAGPPGLRAIAALLPQHMFGARAAGGQTEDPAWVAGMAQAHHEVVTALQAQPACLPLGFGTVFSTATALQDWLAANAARLRACAQLVAGRQEWALSLAVDATRFSQHAEMAEPALAALAQEMAAASKGTAFLLGKRLTKLREGSQAACLAQACANLAQSAEAVGFSIRPEPPRPHATASWSLLAANAAQAGAWARTQQEALADIGLILSCSGPFPPYAFARAGWEDANG